jgi:hypothetical protein
MNFVNFFRFYEEIFNIFLLKNAVGIPNVYKVVLQKAMIKNSYLRNSVNTGPTVINLFMSVICKFS